MLCMPMALPAPVHAEYIAGKGRDAVTTEDVVKAVRPEARSRVPDSIKAELLADIKKFILDL